MKGDKMIDPTGAQGDIVKLVTTNQKHFGFKKPVADDDDFISDFAKSLKDALSKVNNLQNTSDQLTRALAADPDSVDIHDVTIAAEKARLSLTLTKSIVDRITQAYRELINMR